MSVNAPLEDPTAAAPQAAAVRYLAEHGYEQTTASALADAIGMSRSTFFRRFGSKEDVVFSDHDIALARLACVQSYCAAPPHCASASS